MKPASFDPARSRRLDESTFGRPSFPRFFALRVLVHRHGPWVFMVALPVLTLAAMLLLLGGCATVGDVEKVRDDNIAATRATSDAVRDHLIAHPGDFLGAFAVQFRISIAAQEKQKDAAHRPDVAGAVVAVAEELIFGMKPAAAATVGGVLASSLLGALGVWLDKRSKRRAREESEAAVTAHDEADSEGPNGEKVGEPRIVAATLWVERQQSKAAVPA